MNLIKQGPTPGTQGETKTPSDKVHNPNEQKPTTSAEDFTLVSTIAPSVTTQAGKVTMAFIGTKNKWRALLTMVVSSSIP